MGASGRAGSRARLPAALEGAAEPHLVPERPHLPAHVRADHRSAGHRTDGLTGSVSTGQMGSQGHSAPAVVSIVMAF